MAVTKGKSFTGTLYLKTEFTVKRQCRSIIGIHCQFNPFNSQPVITQVIISCINAEATPWP